MLSRQDLSPSTRLCPKAPGPPRPIWKCFQWSRCPRRQRRPFCKLKNIAAWSPRARATKEDGPPEEKVEELTGTTRAARATIPRRGRAKAEEEEERMVPPRAKTLGRRTRRTLRRRIEGATQLLSGRWIPHWHWWCADAPSGISAGAQSFGSGGWTMHHASASGCCYAMMAEPIWGLSVEGSGATNRSSLRYS